MKSGLVLACLACFCVAYAQAGFLDDFFLTFGDTNVLFPNTPSGDTLQLCLNPQSGSGFRSINPYLFGDISMKIKLVGGNSAGTVTSFYMASTFKNWGELDFEFLGNVSGQPYVLQTNVFVEGKGQREQRIFLSFDPTADFHTYGIRWNQNLILFLVDNVVIRVFFNSKDLGIPYLEYQPMYIYSSLFNGDSWATRGGRVKLNWALAPFVASYANYSVSTACAVPPGPGYTGHHACYAQMYRSVYGRPASRVLTDLQKTQLKTIQTKYLIYDYCTDFKRFPLGIPAECARNWPQ